MSKAVIVIGIGFLFVLLPYMGVPTSAKTFVLILGGVLLIVLGILLRIERLWLLRALHGSHAKDAYAESGTRHDSA